MTEPYRIIAEAFAGTTQCLYVFKDRDEALAYGNELKAKGYHRVWLKDEIFHIIC